MVRLWQRLPRVMKFLVLVAGVMVTVTVATSEVVLWRFAQAQKSNLELLTDAYLNGLPPALIREHRREVFDALDHARRNRYAGVEPRFAILELPNGTILGMPFLLGKDMELEGERLAR